MKKEQKNVTKVPQREIDVLFAEYAATRQHPLNRLIHWVCIPLILFSILGLAWSVPFPHLDFLGKYNGFLNWASFLIAFAGYYYYRLSPVLSYMMLLLVFALSLIVVQFEKWQLSGGPALWLVCTVTLVAGVAGLLIGQKIEGKKTSILSGVKFVLIGPIWLLEIFSIKIGLKRH
ncbi:MAG: Mpo1-like protein [Pedobacter sp.]|uniref:Mpo1 family 2-hydroxy fatty acid dioxygenase n=1 Tax=Pedobacter sp. TaxID=1411316 RepID=UPI003398C9CA